MQNLIIRLSRSTIIRRMTSWLRLHKLGNLWLRHFPMVKHLSSGIVYRATRLESIPLAAEMFGQKSVLYQADLLPENFTTFTDLGCNVGYFTCWLAHLAKGKKLRGLMVDANPEVIPEAGWHLAANGLNEVFPLQGIVGEGTEGKTVEFYLYESNICSTNHLSETLKKELRGKWKTIQVPHINIGKQWRQRFGDLRCHVLKIDVEGSELKFLRTEQSFLKQCDSIFVEWHKWAVQIDEIKNFLQANGFAYVKTIEESEQMGTAFFRR